MSEQSDDKTPVDVPAFPERVERLTAEQIGQLAEAIVMRRVYLSAMCPNGLLGSVFMPLALGAFAGAPESYLEDIGQLYEYMDKAGPRSINGQPMFFSSHTVGKEGWQLVMEKGKAMETALKAAREAMP